MTADFETWEPVAAAFDAVVSFTAFHWIDPAVRYEKTARLLRAGGALAIVQTNHVFPEGGDPFWLEVEDDYREVFPDDEAGPPPAPEEIVGMSEELEASGRFARVEERRYVWDVTYSGEEYVGVLETYSGHRAAEPELRERLYELIRRRIDARPGCEVRKSYLALMTRRRAGLGAAGRAGGAGGELRHLVPRCGQARIAEVERGGEVGRGGVARRQCREPEAPLDQLQHGGVVVHGVSDVLAPGERRDQQRRHAEAALRVRGSVSGATAGGTWSKKPPHSSKVITSSVFFQAGLVVTA